ncbi:MAG: AI-2E family transporter [Aerococcus sp.]|nr:AI-2E family transporter [Aerococcus sp.]
MEKEPKQKHLHHEQTLMGSRFTRVLNSRYVLILTVAILVCLLLLLLTKVNVFLNPLWRFIKTILLPIILGSVLYYLTVPIVNFLERKGLKRIYGTWFVLALLVVLIGLFIAWIPAIIAQAKDFLMQWGDIWSMYQDQILNYLPKNIFSDLQLNFDKIFNYIYSLDWNWSRLFNNTWSGLTSILGVIAQIAVAILTAPIILFYMLKDTPKIKEKIAPFLPIKIRKTTLDMLSDMNGQVSGYIRGQILVAIAVTIMFVIGYTIIGLDFGLIIGVTAGVLNIIPYLGSFLGIVPAIIVAVVDSPLMLIKVLLVFAIEQGIESRIISPLVLGSNLHIHPVIIMLLLIAGGNMWGVLGIIFIIPIYAVLKVIFMYIFRWYHDISGLYEDENGQEVFPFDENAEREKAENEDIAKAPGEDNNS